MQPMQPEQPEQLEHPPQIGLGSYSFRWAIGVARMQPAQPLDPESLVQRVAALDCHLVQIADHPALEHCTKAHVRALKERADQLGVTLELGLSGATSARLLYYLDLAQGLGATLVRLALVSADTHPSLDEAYHVVAMVAPRYEAAGVRLAIENHFLLPSPRLIHLIERLGSPAVGVCLDTANSIACGEWPRETIQLLAPFAFNVHLKDYSIMPHPEGIGIVISGAPLGEGAQDLPSIAQAIRAMPHRPSVILEQWLPWQDTEEKTLARETEWARRSLATARRHFRPSP